MIDTNKRGTLHQVCMFFMIEKYTYNLRNYFARNYAQLAEVLVADVVQKEALLELNFASAKHVFEKYSLYMLASEALDIALYNLHVPKHPLLRTENTLAPWRLNHRRNMIIPVDDEPEDIMNSITSNIIRNIVNTRLHVLYTEQTLTEENMIEIFHMYTSHEYANEDYYTLVVTDERCHGAEVSSNTEVHSFASIGAYMSMFTYVGEKSGMKPAISKSDLSFELFIYFSVDMKALSPLSPCLRTFKGHALEKCTHCDYETDYCKKMIKVTRHLVTRQHEHDSKLFDILLSPTKAIVLARYPAPVTWDKLCADYTLTYKHFD